MNLDQAIDSILNEQDHCDRTNHPQFEYRKYKRGRFRCLKCGARIKWRTVIAENTFNDFGIPKFIAKATI